ncbi:hypothetical protein WJX77_005373 [Trebouxia sp. C0004]
MSIAKRGAAIFLPTMLYIMAHTSERAYEAVGPGSDLRDALGDPADELAAGPEPPEHVTAPRGAVSQIHSAVQVNLKAAPVLFKRRRIFSYAGKHLASSR